MQQFNISQPDRTIEASLRSKIDNLAKPQGSLGMLESIALQIGLIQNTLSPALKKPVNILFGGDHGILDEGVSVSPREVTKQQMLNFEEGGAGINFLCRQHGFRLLLVDAGVDFDFPATSSIVNMKAGYGTRNFLKEEAMTAENLELCIRNGAAIVDSVHREGTNIVSFGEMGSGNTSPSAIWIHLLAGIELEQCTGKGASGTETNGIIDKKFSVLKKSLERHGFAQGMKEGADVLDVMRIYGGFEMVSAVGAMLRAAELKMTVIVDGFIMGACALAAIRMYPATKDYMIFSHCGDEKGHRYLLEALGVRPLLNLSLRLGEGTGAVCAYPVIDSAVRMINEMKSFEKASITKYF